MLVMTGALTDHFGCCLVMTKIWLVIANGVKQSEDERYGDHFGYRLVMTGALTDHFAMLVMTGALTDHFAMLVMTMMWLVIANEVRQSHKKTIS